MSAQQATWPLATMREEDRVRVFEGVFAREFEYVCRTARRFSVPLKDVEDVAHDVFVTVYRRLPEYDESRPFRPWLFAIVFRTAVGYLRRARNRLEVADDGADVADAASAADEKLVTEEMHELLWRAFERLDPHKRALLLMHDIEGHSVPILAEALGIPLNTAYTRVRAARLELRRCLLALQQSPDDEASPKPIRKPEGATEEEK